MPDNDQLLKPIGTFCRWPLKLVSQVNFAALGNMHSFRH